MLTSNTQMAGLFTDFGFDSGSDEGVHYKSTAPYVAGTDVSPHDFLSSCLGLHEIQ
jgi:hypothetical protein